MRAPAPRFITPATPGARHEGREIGRVARLLGKPLMPWQQLVVDGATEKTSTGLYRYPVVMITVPRQSGKTTLVGPVQVHRIMTRPNVSAFFTAQTGKDARARMLDLMELVTTSPIASLFKARYAAGSEGLSLANRSSLSVFAPGPSALHGYTPHLVTLDEIWKHDQARGSELMGAIGPAQATLEGESQIWMISTMGTALSGFMNEWVERGRAGHPNLFYAEWSMADGLDPYRPSSWAFHPALGNTITESYLAKEANDQPLGEWMRAYMNRITASSDPLIAAEDWDRLAVDPLMVPSRRKLAIVWEVAHGGESGDVMAVWRDVDGVLCTRTLHSAPGISWMADYVQRLVKDWQPAVYGADDGGETRQVNDELRRRGLEPKTTTMPEFATSSIATITAARDRQLRHDGSATLSRSIMHAVLTPSNDSFRLSRKNSTGPIASLVGLVVGAWLYDHQEKPLSKPVFRSAS